MQSGGGTGIRTLETLSTPGGFQDRCIQPLCHPSAQTIRHCKRNNADMADPICDRQRVAAQVRLAADCGVLQLAANCDGLQRLAAGSGLRRVAAGCSGLQLAAAGSGLRLAAAGSGLRRVAAGRGELRLAAGCGGSRMAAGRGGRRTAAGCGWRRLAAGRGMHAHSPTSRHRLVLAAAATAGRMLERCLAPMWHGSARSGRMRAAAMPHWCLAPFQHRRARSALGSINQRCAKPLRGSFATK